VSWVVVCDGYQTIPYAGVGWVGVIQLYIPDPLLLVGVGLLFRNRLVDARTILCTPRYEAGCVGGW
jgi:hypothetical protein